MTSEISLAALGANSEVTVLKRFVNKFLKEKAEATGTEVAVGEAGAADTVGKSRKLLLVC